MVEQGLGDGSPQRDPGAEARWESGGRSPRSYRYNDSVPISACGIYGDGVRTAVSCFMWAQTSHGVVGQSSNADSDGDAAYRRRLRPRRLRRRRTGVPAAVGVRRRAQGRQRAGQLLQHRRQRLRVRRRPDLPWSTWSVDVVVVVGRASSPAAAAAANCRDVGGRRVLQAGRDVAGAGGGRRGAPRTTNNAPYVVAVARRACAVCVPSCMSIVERSIVSLSRTVARVRLARYLGPGVGSSDPARHDTVRDRIRCNVMQCIKCNV